MSRPDCYGWVFAQLWASLAAEIDRTSKAETYPPDFLASKPSHKLNTDRTVASYGVYNGRDPFWKAWAPVPKRRPAKS